MIKYDRGGWLLASRQLDDDAVDEGVRALLAYYAKRISELAALGLPVESVERCDIGPRPEYAIIANAVAIKKGR